MNCDIELIVDVQTVIEDDTFLSGLNASTVKTGSRTDKDIKVINPEF